MAVVKFYEYPQCSTCKDALKFLVHNRYAVDKVNIFTNPPSKAELSKLYLIQMGMCTKKWDSKKNFPK